MAIAFDASSKDLITTGTLINFTHTPVGTPSLVVASFHMRDDVTQINGTPTYGGTNMALAVRLVDSVNSLSVEIWYLANPPSGIKSLIASIDDSGIDTRTYVATFTGTSTSQSTVLGGTANNDDSESVDITPSQDGALIYGAIVSELTGSAPSTGSGETAISNDDEGAWANGASYAIQVSAAFIGLLTHRLMANANIRILTTSNLNFIVRIIT